MFDSEPSVVDAIKRKLRYWIIDHTGIRPPKTYVRFWAQALREVADEFEAAIRQEEAQVEKSVDSISDNNSTGK